MVLKNKYAINLAFPQTFQELLYRVTKWRQTRQSLYNIAYSIKPYQVIAINTSTTTQDIETFNNVLRATLSALDTIETFFESNSSYIPKYYPKNPTLVQHQTVSTTTPLRTVAGENIAFDIDNLHKGVIQILKTYGQFDIENTLWVMNSREDAFRAYDLILNDYPIFPQLIYNFPYPDPILPTFQQNIGNISANSNNPIIKYIYDKGLDIILNSNSNMFSTVTDNNVTPQPLAQLTVKGTFKITHYNSGGTSSVVVDNITNYAQSNVIDENPYIYTPLEIES